jgi:hypothetical protein
MGITRTFASRIALSAVLAAALLGALANSAFAVAPGWRVVHTSNPDKTSYEPRLSGDRVVYASVDASGVTHAMTFKIGDSSATTLTTGQCYGYAAEGDRLAWITSDGLHEQVWTKVMGGPTYKLTSSTRNKSHVALKNGRLVWCEREGIYDQIWTCVPAVSTAVSDIATDAVARYDVTVDGNRVVWVQSDATNAQIWGWNAATGTKGPLSWGNASHESPTVSGSRCTWMESTLPDLGRVVTRAEGDATPTVISANPRCYGPVISGDRIAWFESEIGHDAQLFTKTVGESKATQVTSGEFERHSFQLDGDRLIWSEKRYGAWCVCTWKAGQPGISTVVAGPDAIYPSSEAVSGNNIAWAQIENGHFRVYAGTATATSLSKLAISPSKRKKGKKLTFSANLVPGAASLCRVKVTLLHWEKHKWRVRSTVTLKPVAAGSTRQKGSAKLSRTGKWKAVASYSGWNGYLPSNTLSKTFKVN